MDCQKSTVKNDEKLKKLSLDAPSDPGVYIMKDGEGQIIYIGKAKNLKNRLKSYFSGKEGGASYNGKDIKTAALLKHVAAVETIIVKNEYEALLLENTLIKQHSPKYNINLKDGKSYPVIRITPDDFPRIHKTRRVIHDNSLYFGPFPDVQNTDRVLELIDKLFPLRKCKKLGKKGPCVYYHIGRCMAPCCRKITKEEYAHHVNSVIKLLSGETDSLIIDLASKMHEASRALDFEKAAQLRNAIKAIENLTGCESAVEDLNPEDRDYIAWAQEGLLSTYTVFSIRGGKMTGRDLFRTRSASDESESLETFITSYYDTTRPPPAKIYLQEFLTEARRNGGTEEEKNERLLIENTTDKLHEQISDNDPLSPLNNWFQETFAYLPELLLPTDKHHAAIMAMARQNAAEDLRKRLKERGAGPALEELSRLLNLKEKPQRIEGFDISQLGGTHPVASLVSFKNGVPDKKNYRHFKLRTVVGKVDDFAAMREVIRRRYSRLIKEGSELPDLILVDGGLGQVNAAKGVLDELGLECALAGLAKREEEIWLPGTSKPLVLSRQSEALKVLQHVRDESHRFATGLNARLRSKDLFFHVLESVEGIGPKRAAVIMKEYETIANIAAAEIKELARRCKIGEEAARAVRACAKLSLAND